MSHITNRSYPDSLPLDIKYVTSVWIMQTKDGAMPTTWKDTAYTGDWYEEANQFRNPSNPDQRIVRRRVYHQDEVVHS